MKGTLYGGIICRPGHPEADMHGLLRCIIRARSKQHVADALHRFETGLIHLKGKEPLPMVGPTSGAEYEKLKKDEKSALQVKQQIERYLRSTVQCTQCKRRWSWFNPKEGWSEKGSVVVKWMSGHEVLTCPDLKCAGPCVVVEDAMSVRGVPGGKL
jgi:hypothetical protein